MSSSLSLPFRLLRREPLLLSRFVIGSLVRAALASVVILLIHQFLAGVLGHEGGWASELLARFGIELSLWSVVAMLAIAQCGVIFLAYDARVSEQRILAVVELGAMERVIHHVLGFSADFFDGHTHGDFVQSVRHDVANLRHVTASLSTVVIEATQAFALIAVAVKLSPSLAMWTFVLLPVAVVPITVMARRTVIASGALRRKNVVVFDMLLQLIQGIRIIKIYEAEAQEAARTSDRAKHYFDELLSMERSRALARAVLDSMSGMSMLVVVVVGGLQVMAGTLGWAELLAFFLAARAVQGPLNNLNTSYFDIKRHRASVVNIEELLRTRATVADSADALPITSGPGRVELRDVSFSMGEAEILQQISVTVESGETVGIVGRSGSGKTTLMNLIARFYDPTSGSITFDGVDIRKLRLADLHQRIAIVTQDPFLFTTTLSDNIGRGRPGASQGEIEAAARAAEIHDEIVAMPEGYRTVVGHGGRPLSRGEAQRVNIARAILKNAPILLLDEATSSLDSWSEARVQKALDRLVEGKLVFSIAHRLATLRDATKILVLDNGRMAGLGTHRELLATSETYQKLWNAQFHESETRVEDGVGEVVR